MFKEFPPGDLGNLRLPGDHIVRTRELREAHDQVLSCEVFIIISGAENPRELGA